MKHMILVAIAVVTLSINGAAMAQSYSHQAPSSGSHAVND
jgi:hypothetical protein